MWGTARAVTDMQGIKKHMWVCVHTCAEMYSSCPERAAMGMQERRTLWEQSRYLLS
jgi:hypothetical protein